MAKNQNLRGIFLEINGSTTGIQEALKEVEARLKNTQSSLIDVGRLLKLDPTNVELLSQKQEALASQVENTKQKLDTLKEASRQAQEQMERGELGRDKYDALQREIIRTEQELEKLTTEAAKASAS